MHWDVAGIGNALMDALVVIEDDGLIEELGLTRGTMHPVDHDRWDEVYQRVRTLNPEFHSGGSCANSIATAGRLGSKALYRGQVGDDQLGHLYASLLEKSCGGHALRFDKALSTGKCLSLISARDRERTMLTDLGAAVHLPELGGFSAELQRTKVAHFTGYTLLDGPTLPVVLEAMGIAKAGGAQVSLDAADPFVTSMIPDRFREVMAEHVDIAFLNEDESKAISGLTDPEESARKMAADAGLRTVCVKLGSRGSVVLHEGDLVQIPVYPVEAKDTTGAGDAYAGAFLHGITHGWDAERAGKLASAVAALTVSQVGAVVEDQERLQSVLRDLAPA